MPTEAVRAPLPAALLLREGYYNYFAVFTEQQAGLPGTGGCLEPIEEYCWSMGDAPCGAKALD